MVRELRADQIDQHKQSPWRVSCVPRSYRLLQPETIPPHASGFLLVSLSKTPRMYFWPSTELLGRGVSDQG
jgi:hypothetical protein